MLIGSGAARGRQLLLAVLVPSVSAPLTDGDDLDPAGPSGLSPTDRAPPSVRPIRFVGRSRSCPTYFSTRGGCET